jgi:uncharacterized repeat protein (TIGR01451 family)
MRIEGFAVAAALAFATGVSVVAMQGQVSSITLAPASPVAPGTSVTVTVSGAGACGAIEINFGDGTDQTFAVSGVPFSQAHTYPSAGTFTITAKGQGNCGGQTSTSLVVAVPPPPPPPPAPKPDLVAAIHQDTPNPIVTLTQVTYAVTVSTAQRAKVNNVEVLVNLEGQWTAPPGGPGQGCAIDPSHPPLRMFVRCTTSVLERPATITVKMIPSLLIGIASPADRSVEVFVNPDRRIAESDFNNNRTVIHTQLTGLPELNFNTANEPTSAHTGQELSYPVRMQNFGDLDAHNVVVHVDLPRQLQFVRVDQSQYDSCNIGPPDAQDRRVLTCTRALAAAGSAFGATVITHVSNDLAQTQTALVAMSVDPDNAIREHDETNNTFGVATTIQLAPDLAVTSVTVDSVDPGTAGCTTLGPIVVSGGTISTTKVARVRVAIANVGAGGAAASSLEIDLNQALFDQSQAFGSCDVPAIAAGQSTTVTFIINTNRTGNLGHVTIDPLHFTGDFNGANQTKDIIR